MPNEVMWPPGVVHAYGKRSLTGDLSLSAAKIFCIKLWKEKCLSMNEMIVELQREKGRKREGEYSSYSLHQPSLIIYTEDYLS